MGNGGGFVTATCATRGFVVGGSGEGVEVDGVSVAVAVGIGVIEGNIVGTMVLVGVLKSACIVVLVSSTVGTTRVSVGKVLSIDATFA